MEEIADRIIQQQIQLQLTEKGEYSPIELLIARGRLLYVDYEEWRRGRLDSLDQVLIGKLSDITALLKQAEAFAEGTGLAREPHHWTPWMDQDDIEAPEASVVKVDGKLIASDRSELSDQLCCRFIPPRHQLQLDLFYDNVSTSLENRVVQAFSSRSLGAVEEAISELYNSDPSHAELGQYDHLKRYLKHCNGSPCRPEGLAKEFIVLSEKIVPIAHTALKSRARDFLVPCWVRLIDVCADMEPDQRPSSVSLSRLHWEIGNWQGVIDASADELAQDISLDLFVRRALAFDRLHQMANSYRIWFLISLIYPSVFVELVNEQPDEQLRALWSEFEAWMEEYEEQQEKEAAVDELSGWQEEKRCEALAIELFFPAFSLLKRRGLVQQMSGELVEPSSPLYQSLHESEFDSIEPALQLYVTVHKLITVDSVENIHLTPDHAERSIELRKQLSDLSKPVMKLYLAG